jgi:hypothetical protein
MAWAFFMLFTDFHSSKVIFVRFLNPFLEQIGLLA